MRSLAIASFLAMGASFQAFLIPPGLNDKIDAAAAEISSLIPHISSVKAKTVEVKCPNCPYFEGFGEDGTPFYSQKDNSLVLGFDVGTDFISMNGHPFFPGAYGIVTPAPFFAEQKPTTEKSAKPLMSKQVDFAFDLFVETDAKSISRVRVHVTSVAGMPTDTHMDIVEFPVYQGSDGGILMGDPVVRRPTSSEVSSALCKDAILCKWMAYFNDKLLLIKDKYHGTVKGQKKGGCKGGKKGNKEGKTSSKHDHKNYKEEHEHKIDDNHKEEAHDSFKGYFDPGEEPQYGILMSILVFAVIPVIVGTIVGMSVCLIGVVVGHCVIAVWRKITGKTFEIPHSGSKDEEKEGLLKGDEEDYDGRNTIPEYADGLPAYIETEERL